MTLREVDWLQKHHAERFYEYFLFLQEKIKKEIEEIEKLKGQKDGAVSTESDKFRLVRTPEEDEIEKLIKEYE